MKKVKEEKRKRYTADFETLTLTKEQVEAGQRTYVWAWAVCEINTLHTEYGTEISTFFDFISKLDHCSTLYFHNEKFDGSFIINYLLKNGYTQRVCKMYELPNKCFSVLASGMGVFYSIVINFNNKLIIINDSLKKLPFTVRQIANSLGFEEGKGDIDYTEFRQEGGTLSETDKDYIRRDVEIVAKALKLLFFDQGLYSLTIGADCMKFYKNMCKQFNYYYPLLDQKEDSFVRKSYRGGKCMVNPDIAGKHLQFFGQVLDVNSMYPWAMATQILPIGQGKYYEGQYRKNNEYPLYVAHVRCAFDVKPGFIPTIQMKENMFYKQNEYVTTTNGEIEDLYLTSVDLEQFKKHYNYWLFDPEINCMEYVDGYMYHGAIGIFNKYIDYWYAQKEEASKNKNKVLKLRAKLFLNNLYGKLATNPNGSYLVFDIDNKEGKLTRTPVCDNRDSVYIPTASFITAYARKKLDTAIQDNYDRFLYCDTDSIHLKGLEPAKGVEIHPTKLGAWDREMVWTEAKFLRQKTYAEHPVNEDWQFKCAGLPSANNKLTIDTFYSGSVIKDAKLMSKQINGGIVLLPTDYVINKR